MPLGGSAPGPIETRGRLDQAVLDVVTETSPIEFGTLCARVAIEGDYLSVEAALFRLRRENKVRIDYLKGLITCHD